METLRRYAGQGNNEKPRKKIRGGQDRSRNEKVEVKRRREKVRRGGKGR